MTKAYLNILLSVDGAQKLALVEAHIGDKPAGELGAREANNFWATVYEQEADTFEQAQARIEFLLDRGDMRQLAGLVLLKKAVEKSLGRRIGDGTIVELLPPEMRNARLSAMGM